jgi:hypothetical protein
MVLQGRLALPAFERQHAQRCFGLIAQAGPLWALGGGGVQARVVAALGDGEQASQIGFQGRAPGRW